MPKNLVSSVLHFSKAWLPPLLWALFIYVLSDQGVLPKFDEDFADFIFKKSAHMFVYAVLYLLFYRAISHSLRDQHTPRFWIYALVLTFIYAASDELHQMFVPGRYGTIRDVGYDMLGASIALLRQYQYI
jgi:VanZ family protein